MRKLFLVALFCAQVSVQQAAYGCPSHCACAAEHITCDFKYITQSIQDSFIEPAYWNLSHNNITRLDDNTFHVGRHFKSIFVLDLSCNQISHVSETAFTPLKNMLQLNMSNNNITNIGFKHMHAYNFRSLDLSHNPHLKLSEHGFGLRNLINLQMVECGLTRMPNRFFTHMKKIKILGLRKNNLIHMTSSTLEHLDDLLFLDLSENKFTTFPSELLSNLHALVHIKLDNNPFRCHCSVHHSYKIYTRQKNKVTLHCHLYDKTNATTHLSFHRFFEDHCHLNMDNPAVSSSKYSSSTRLAVQPTNNISNSNQADSSFSQMQNSYVTRSHVGWLSGLIAIILLTIILILSVSFKFKRNLQFREPSPQMFSILKENDDV